MNFPGLALALLAFGIEASLLAQNSLSFSAVRKTTSQEIALSLSAPVGPEYRLQTSADLIGWQNWSTFAGAASTLSQTDSAAPFLPARFYRAYALAEINLLTGDHLSTTNGDLIIHPINHAAFVINWDGQWIYNDPVAPTAGAYNGIPKANLIFITHSHADHFDSATLGNVKSTATRILAPKAVYDAMSSTLKSQTTVLTNGQSLDIGNIHVDCIPMYNTSPDRLTRHPKGFGNGYIVTMANRRIYISGDTEDTPEMLALRDIDLAFLCMSLPSNMTVQQAAGAVRTFKPKIVYPYHYTGSDPGLFKQLVGLDPGIDVRLRKWY